MCAIDLLECKREFGLLLQRKQPEKLVLDRSRGRYNDEDRAILLQGQKQHVARLHKLGDGV
ncbi:hypothetical protein D3C87_1503530 [compost metagenome]